MVEGESSETMTKKGFYVLKETLGDKNLTATEKMIYSIVDNFNSKGCFQSNRALADFLGCGITTVKDGIKSLESKGYIKKVESEKHKRLLKANRPESDSAQEKLTGRNPAQERPESDENRVKTDQERPEIDPPSKIKGNLNKKKSKVKFESNSESFRLAQLLFENIRSRKPDFKKPNISNWSVVIDRMMRLDKRKAERIEKVIKWSQMDPFWQNNILSTEKLRKHFDRLEMLMDGNKNGGVKKYQRDFSRPESSVGDVIEM